VESNDDLVVTESDVANLNRRTVERSASIARSAGTVLVVVGAVGVAAWVWIAVRTQDRGGMVQYGLVEDLELPGLSISERIDLFAGSLSLLMFSAAVVGVGLFLRVAGDYGQTRVGGSVTGFQVGDRLGEDTP
jgi:hypothetical protein